MGSCNLCKYPSEDKIIEKDNTLETPVEALKEKKPKNNISEINIDYRVNTVSSGISANNSISESIYIIPTEISKHENIKKFYEISTTILGRGGSSYIFLSQKNNSLFAVKQVLKGGVAKPEEILREANISLSLKHEHIIKFYEIFEDYYSIYFVMELGNYGDLFEFITFSEQGYLSPDITIDLLIQIFEAVDYLHNNRKIIHRDIKAENFVLCINEYNQLNIKLIDFGLAIKKPENGEILYDIIGTRKYQSPEMINGNGYNEKVDEWALGVVMFSMLTGYEPFRRTGEHKLEESILYDGINFEIIPDDDLRLLNARLLDRNVDTRITCQEALNFLKNLKLHRDLLYNDQYYLYQRNMFIDEYKRAINEKLNLYQRDTI